MANTCATDYCISSKNKSCVEVARDYLLAALSPDSKGELNYNWLGKVFEFGGVNPGGYECSGFVNLVQLKESSVEYNERLGEYYLKFYVEDKWYPHPDFAEFLCKKFPGLSYCLSAEELGCGVAINTDLTREYFPWDYIIDDMDNGIEYYSSEHFFNKIGEILELPGRPFNTFEGVQKYLDDNNIENIFIHKLSDTL